MFECSSCGANLKYDIGLKKLKCEHCGKKYGMDSKVARTIPSTHKEVRWSEDSPDAEMMEVTVFTCPQCGAELYSEDNSATAYCVYCGTDSVLEQRLAGVKRPRRILPFRLTKDLCREEIRKCLKWHLFAPKELRKGALPEHMRPVYVPYWDCSAQYEGELIAEGKKKTLISDCVIVCETCDVQTNVTAKVSNIQIEGSAVFDDTLSEGIAPFPAEESREFLPAYLAGMYAEVSDVDSEVYKAKIAAISRRKLQDNIGKTLGIKMKSEPEDAPEESFQADAMMFPVWFTSFRQGKRIAYAVVNGRTGQVACDVPIDLKKYFLVTAALMLPMFLIFNIKYTLLPMAALNIAAALACITGMFAAVFHARVQKREEHTDDPGYRSKNGTLSSDFSAWTKLSPEARDALDFIRKSRIEKQQEKDAKKPPQEKIDRLYRHRGGWCLLAIGVLGLPVIGGLIFLAEFGSDLRTYFSENHWLTMVLLGLTELIFSLWVHSSRPARSGRDAFARSSRRIGTEKARKRFRVRFPGVMSTLEALLFFAAAFYAIAPANRMYYYYMTAALFLTAFACVVQSVLAYNRLSTRPLPFLKTPEDIEKEKRGHGTSAVIVSLLLCLALVACLIGSAMAAENSAEEGSTRKPGEIAEGFVETENGYWYERPNPGYYEGTYAAMIDLLGLMSFEEQQMLCEQLRELTHFGDIAVISLDDPATSEHFGDWHIYESLFDLSSGTIVIFDGYTEQVLVFCHGRHRKIIDDNTIRSIKDNITPLAEKGEYYACASEALSEISDLLDGKRIAQPMKYFNNAMISGILAGLLVFIVILVMAKPRKMNQNELLYDTDIKCTLRDSKVNVTSRYLRIVWDESDC